MSINHRRAFNTGQERRLDKRQRTLIKIFYECLHENFVTVPADKASNNYTFICKKYYVSILIEELGLNSLPGNPTYNLTDFSA